MKKFFVLMDKFLLWKWSMPLFLSLMWVFPLLPSPFGMIGLVIYIFSYFVILSWMIYHKSKGTFE